MFAYRMVGSHHGHDGTSDDYCQLYKYLSGMLWKVNSLFIRKTMESKIKSYVIVSKVSDAAAISHNNGDPEKPFKDPVKIFINQCSIT
jgi:hypothetical protein